MDHQWKIKKFENENFVQNLQQLNVVTRNTFRRYLRRY